MMVVNGFWMGVLVTLVVEIILICVAAYISVTKSDRGEQNGKEGTDKKRD